MSGEDLKREFGDYQTPEDFADIVCKFLYSDLKLRPRYIIEPTAGIGNFIKASLKIFTESVSIVGIEVNKDYCNRCEASIQSNKVQIKYSNFFGFDLTQYAANGDETLIIGNPPWATNSELNFNLPKKVNFKKLSGTDAITGASNFDICEYIILQLINAFKGTNAVVAMLCKTSVARNILQELNRTSEKTEYVKMVKFNASKVFGISASACLLVVKLSNTFNNASICEVSDIDAPSKIIKTICCKNGVLSSQVDGIKDLEGNCQCEWRQGVKHDCSGIMELERVGKSLYRNKKREDVELEETLVFPLMKSSDFKEPIINNNFKKYVIVTQKKAREDTSYIEFKAPHTWRYLNLNKKLFDSRKSSIYKGAPAFSMFGVGDYSYAKYKVGISGFYKKPLFCILYNESEIEHTVMLDDTTYFLSFDSYDYAYACMVLLNSESVQDFLYSISFKDAKRPYTKKVLQRLDLKKCFEMISIDELIETEKRLRLKPYITEKIYSELKKLIG